MGRTGMVLGKFMPVHNGHVALIRFAADRVDKLIVLICAHSEEPLPAKLRKSWVQQIFPNSNIEVLLVEYDKETLPDSSTTSIDSSRLWAEWISKNVPAIDAIFTSEKYGEYVADLLHIEHNLFDKERTRFPVSGSDIRRNPIKFWTFLPKVVQPFFVKKIFILGTESTGKSRLTQRLAEHFSTNYVSEIARDIVDNTYKVTIDDLHKIASAHANRILEQLQVSNKFLFIDTDINTTKSYSNYLFEQPLQVEAWIEEANRGDLYFYLEPDCPFNQDGTRLSKKDRDRLDTSHKKQLRNAKIQLHLLSGNWEDRFNTACKIIEDLYFRD